MRLICWVQHAGNRYGKQSYRQVIKLNFS